MVTHKSLIVSFALILALVCAGVVATSAHTALSAQRTPGGMPPVQGIAAIAATHRNTNLLSFLDVRHYLDTKGFIGGPTLSGRTPTLQDLRLLSVAQLNNLLNFVLPEQPGDKMVYYAHINGPFLVVPNLPLPVLTTLLPSLSNLPAFLPHLGNLSWLGLFTAGNGSLSNILPLGRLPDLSHAQGRMPDLSHVPGSPVKGNGWGTVLASAYEIFDAHTGNLLAWG